jgi:hypothetical protein
VVGNPATPNCSLTVIGTPSNGAFSERRVGGSSGGMCSVEIAHHDGVDLRIQRLDGAIALSTSSRDDTRRFASASTSSAAAR